MKKVDPELFARLHAAELGFGDWIGWAWKGGCVPEGWTKLSRKNRWRLLVMWP